MPIEIHVGPPDITINQGRTIMVTSREGEIAPETNQGVYAFDTRFISLYRLFINRKRLQLIDSSPLTFYSSRTHLTNPEIETETGKLTAQTIHISITRTVGKHITENFDIVNYSGEPATFQLELALGSDFADIFEVKAHHRTQRGTIETSWDKEKQWLCTGYKHQDFHRTASYHILNDVPASYANGRIIFKITLKQNEHWHTRNEFVLEHGSMVPWIDSSRNGKTEKSSIFTEMSTEDLAKHQAHWKEQCTQIDSDNKIFTQMYHQAIEDMGALRLYDMDVSDNAWVPSAGVPWFVTLFGRDSLIASYENMMVAANYGPGTLQRLAEHQATEKDDWRDAQPGKIVHEIRFGEIAHFHMKPLPYYGTADATILYLILLSETYRWSGNVELLKTYRTVAEKCLNWIDTYGDLDGDGFQEYQTYSKNGYENQGWKDGQYAVMYPDGTQVKQPKGICELQGYVYDAKLRMSECFCALGDEARATALQQQAKELKQRFNQTFWLEDEGVYAYGLDSNKRPIRSVASNAGLCLWSGIADAEKAKRTARRLLQKDMWSGWGVRTLSSLNPAYNPLAYQRGAVWPHDNGMIAAGCKRYGLIQEANQIIRGVLDAIEHFDAYRPPEVFAGVERQGDLDFPVLYPKGANIPQAWSTGSIFHMLRVILGLRADAANKRLYIQPTLPSWLNTISIRRLQVGPSSIALHFWREGEESRWEIDEIKTDSAEHAIEIVEEKF